jgi:hypothetical protein
VSGVEQLAPDHVGEAAEDRQKRRHRQQIGHRDPAHGAQPCVEFELEVRQQHLRDAGIDLAHERADAHGGDDEPPIGFVPRDGRRRRRLAAAADRFAQRGERGGARRVIHSACSWALPDHYLSLWRRTVKSKSFDLKHFSLDSRYTNLPEEGIHRNHVWT